jgi:hypothetical protein
VASQDPQAGHSTGDGAPDQLSIRATVVGTFSRAPEPGAEPFAAEGDIVQPGQQVAILEAMKMMLPVEATAPASHGPACRVFHDPEGFQTAGGAKPFRIMEGQPPAHSRAVHPAISRREADRPRSGILDLGQHTPLP